MPSFAVANPWSLTIFEANDFRMSRITILSLILLISFQAGAQKKRLELNLEKGQVYKLVQVAKSNVKQEVYGMPMELDMEMVSGMSFKVEEIEDDLYIMHMNYDSLVMQMNGPTGTETYSSEEEGQMMSYFLGRYKKVPVHLKMNRQGQILEVSNMDAGVDSLFTDLDTMVSPIEMEQIKAQLKKAYGAEAFKGSIEMCTNIYPQQKVRVGDKWNIETRLEAGMAASLNTEYEFKGREGDNYLINGKGLLETADKEAYVEINGNPARFDLRGDVNSEIKVDRKTGWIVYVKIKQQIKGDTYILPNERFSEGLKIPMDMQNENVLIGE